jgi:Methylamine utilisation protein MauE
VLCLAAAAKLRSPGPARAALETLHLPASPAAATLLASAELAAGAWWLIAHSFAAALTVAAAYLAFALAASALARRRAACGCFGDGERPTTGRHAALSGALAAVCALAAAAPPAPLDGPRAVAAVLLAACLVTAYTVRPGPLADRAVGSLGALLERRTDRRGLLARATLAGTALAVAPIRYLVRPGDAWARIVPGDCGGGLCSDGYSAFCCQIQHGNNRCPPNTYPAGWWMCTSYKGSGLCAAEGVRFYIDCNRTPGTVFPGGCQCANGSCDERRVDCNHFRYGQCNTQVSGTTEVVCRLIVCQNPATIEGMNCNQTLAIDNRVCYHEAECLAGLAVQLPGGGGA